MRLESFVCQRIKFAGLHIGLELAIPGFSIERGIPPAKRRKLCGREFLDLLFDGFNFAHTSLSRQVYQPHEPLSARSKQAAARCETEIKVRKGERSRFLFTFR